MGIPYDRQPLFVVQVSQSEHVAPHAGIGPHCTLVLDQKVTLLSIEGTSVVTSSFPLAIAADLTKIAHFVDVIGRRDLGLGGDEAVAGVVDMWGTRS
jgi:hypothetical protein